MWSLLSAFCSARVVKGVGIPYVVFVICFGKGIGFSLTWNRNRFSSVNADKHLYVRE